jgi:large subunit ribosomal protein L30
VTTFQQVLQRCEPAASAFQVYFAPFTLVFVTLTHHFLLQFHVSLISSTCCSMTTMLRSRSILFQPQWRQFQMSRSLATTTMHTPSSVHPSASDALSKPPNTHFKITLRRSAISLGSKKQGTLVSLGIHRRMQTVYHPHCPEVAGKILLVKELVEVENVPTEMVRTKQEMKRDRMPNRGYQVVGSKRESFMCV